MTEPTADPSEVRIGDYVVHPLRRFVPEHSPAQIDAYVESMRTLGQIHQITLDEQGRIMDGRATLRVCLRLGLTPRFAPEQVREKHAEFVLQSMAGYPYTVAQKIFAAAHLLDSLKRDRKKFTGSGRLTEVAAKYIGGGSAPNITRAAAILKSIETARDPQEKAWLQESVGLVQRGLIHQFQHVEDLIAVPPDRRQDVLAKLLAPNAEPGRILREIRTVTGDEWYTPRDIAAAITWAFGGEIACDPCYPSNGGSPIQAKVTYTQDQNGLEHPWADGTYCNPPFSDTKPWIQRAIQEAEAGNRVYLLLPVHTDTITQLAVINAAVDVLLLKNRVSFVFPDDEEHKNRKSRTGWNALMIVGLLCSTKPLAEMGIAGKIIRSSTRELLTIIEPKRKPTTKAKKASKNRDIWTFTPHAPVTEPDPSEWHRDSDEDRTAEFAEARMKLEADLTRDAHLIEQGRRAVLQARDEMKAEAEAAKAARKAKNSKKEPQKVLAKRAH